MIVLLKKGEAVKRATNYYIAGRFSVVLLASGLRQGFCWT